MKDALMSGNVGEFAEELVRVKESESFDLLTITDPSGKRTFASKQYIAYQETINLIMNSLMQ